MEEQMKLVKQLASSEEANEIVVAVTRLFEKHPDRKDDVLDFITGLLMSRYESPARAVFQAETMKYMCMTRNLDVILPHVGSLLDFFRHIKGAEHPEEKPRADLTRLEAVKAFVLSRRADIEKDVENFGILKPVLDHFLEEAER